MNRRVRAPFVSTVATVVLAGAALSGSACGPNPPSADCPSELPANGDSCDGRSSCTYDSPGCEGSSSRTRATCEKGGWRVTQEGASCNPPFPRPDSGTFEPATDADSAACPASEPAIGAACDGGTCSYANLCPQTSMMKSNVYRCVGAKWSFESTALAPIECPKTEPRNGEACACAMYLPATCNYGGNEAVCDGATQKWLVKAPATTDAGSDASADAAPS